MSQTTQTAPANEQDTKSFHWVMTAQAEDGLMNTRSAVITVPAGFTRDEAYQYVVQQFREDYGPVIVLFFDLQPNQL